jgi:hypothetical protein
MDAPHSLSLSNATASSIARFGAAHDVTNATVADLVAAFPSFPITNGQSQAFNVTGGATNTSAGGWAGNALSLTNVIGTNIVNPTTAFVSSSNSITLNNGYWTFNATTNVAITNIVGSVSGNATWAILSVSNSGAGTMAVYVTAANVRALGVLSTAANTNGIQVAGGKVAIVSVLGIGNQITNYLDCVQQ